MGNKVSLEGDRLVIKLDELEVKVLAKAFPLIAPMAGGAVGVLVRVVLMLATTDKDLFAECFERVENGEDLQLVAKEMFDRMGMTLERLASLVPKVDMPSTEEINKILGWESKE